MFEAVVNAAVHRDYSIADAKIRLFLFDDRLELYSPGALPNTLPIEAMRQRQATRNETLASLLRMLEVGDVHGAGDRQYYLEQRGEGVPIIFEETRALTGSEPVFELIGEAELRLTMPSARPPVPGIQGEVSVTAQGRPLGGATVLALYPNKTWMMEETDGECLFSWRRRASAVAAQVRQAPLIRLPLRLAHHHLLRRSTGPRRDALVSNGVGVRRCPCRSSWEHWRTAVPW